MKATLSRYLRQQLLAAALERADLHLALHLMAPGTPGTQFQGELDPATEGGYVRVPITLSFDPERGTHVNLVGISFPTATSAWGRVTHASLWDALVGGNLLLWAPLVEKVIVNRFDLLEFLPGQLSFALETDENVEAEGEA